MLDLATITKAINDCQTLEQLEEIFTQYLGKKGELSQAMKTLKDLNPDEKKRQGNFLGTLKKEAQEIYNHKLQALQTQEINKQLQQEIIDISLPANNANYGHYNLLTKTRREIEEICQQMGFQIEYGHEVVSKYENFEAVNIPLTHPATDMHDTIYLTQQDTRNENMVMRTHTSAMQNAIMHKYDLPIKVVIPGKVYRFENLDASHDTMFYQLEGMYIDKNISIADAKKIITDLLSAIFGFNVSIRMRPGYFPFVEPGFEIDATCPICQGQGCNLCKTTGRIEILGAGMIHPNVLREGGLDPEIYSGFAFGLGVNRLVAIKYGIKDIRLFTNGDLRFARSW